VREQQLVHDLELVFGRLYGDQRRHGGEGLRKIGG
jgi:hypothetical protein